MPPFPPAEHDLYEDFLFDEAGTGSGSDDEEQRRAGAASSEEPEQQQQPPTAAPQQRALHSHHHAGSRQQPAGVDIITGASSASHQSSTLRASLEDELAGSGPTPSPPVDVPGGFRRTADATQLPHQFGGKAQHQHQQQYTRLGTSAPIAIPNMGAWRDGGLDGKGGRHADAASTFIPPHQLSRQEDFTFSFNGASPSGTLKRERLRARNAILRSTGFLEPRAGQASPAGAAPVPAVPAAAADAGAVRAPVQSSLTAALTTIGET